MGAIARYTQPDDFDGLVDAIRAFILVDLGLGIESDYRLEEEHPHHRLAVEGCRAVVDVADDAAQINVLSGDEIEPLDLVRTVGPRKAVMTARDAVMLVRGAAEQGGGGAVEHVLGFQAREGGGAGVPFQNGRLGVRVKILPQPTDMAAFREGYRGWSHVMLDDGSILAVELVEGWFSDEDTRLEKIPDPLHAYPVDEAEDPTWTADARELRNKLAAFLESLPKVDYLQATVGGNGTGMFSVSYGEAGLMVALGRDPSAC